MADEHIKRSPFERNTKTDEQQEASPLINRIDFGSAPKADNKPAEVKFELPKLETKPETPKQTEVVRTSETDKSNPAPKIDTKPIHEIQAILQQTTQLEDALMKTCFEKQPDGSVKMKEGKIPDGQGGQIEVSKVMEQLIGQINEGHMVAVTIADTAMKNPDAVIGATMSTKKELEAATNQTQTLKKDLAAQGINPAVGDYLDATLISRYIQDNKNLTPPQIEKLSALKTSVENQSNLEGQYRELRIMQETPIVTRQRYADFLKGVENPAAELAMASSPNMAKKMIDDAKAIANELNSPVGRSELMNRLESQITQARDASFDNNIREKYLANPNNPYTLVESAAQKTKAGDIDGARQDMDKARMLAAKPFDVEKDVQELQKQIEDANKDRMALEERVSKGTATQLEVQIQQERQLKLINEAQILDSFKYAKQKVDIAYADFLLNGDKNKDSESNRKYARDILLNLRFDEAGKAAASQSGEQFDALMERALKGSDSNQASMLAFNKAMQEYDALKQKAATEKNDEDIVKDFKLAREKAAQAATIAARINRDGANENEVAVKSNLQKEINQEMSKPAAERDTAKIEMLQAVMKPPQQQTAREKELVAGLVECMKPADQANKAVIDKLAGSLKDKSALFDAVSAYSMIQQMEFQKQAVNQARLAMLDIDIAFDKGEKNPLVAEIEKDKYGADMISMLNSVPGHDGRTQWGDIKEATRELGWGESLWKWTKGALKEVAISLASWTVGALAGVGAAALFSWSGPGAIIGGGAVGFAAGAATGSAIRHYVFGDKVTLVSAALDGVSGMTGGVAGTTYAVARGAGTAAIKNVIAQQAERGIVIGEGQTFAAFRAAGLADKFAIAAGGSRFLASFSAATAGSIAYRYPSEALTGNYQSAGDWALGSTYKVATDVPGNLLGSFFGGKAGGLIENRVLANGGSMYSATAKQLAANFFWTSPAGKNLFGGRMPQPYRSEFNAPLYDALVPKENQEK